MLRKYHIDQDDFNILEEVVQLQQPYKAGKPWKFAGSFYYATTVLTTIGKKTHKERKINEVFAFTKCHDLEAKILSNQFCYKEICCLLI